MTKRLLLVGSGHVHLEVLRRLGTERPAGIECTVVSPDARHIYSGMVPGYLAGQYALEAIGIDVDALCRFAGARRMAGRVQSLDPVRRTATLEDGNPVGYDIVSLNLGARTRDGRRDDVLAHARSLQPAEALAGLRNALQALAARPGTGPRRATVVGAGAGGIEVAFAACQALAAHPAEREVWLVEARSDILPGYAPGFVRRVEQAIAKAGIRLRKRSPVERVQADGIAFAHGERLPSDLVMWVTGAEAPSALGAMGIARDAGGFAEVDSTLQSVSAPGIFAAGDCACLVEHRDLPKAGVFAVRQAPVLYRNLLAALRDESPAERFVPQDGFLSILNTCDGRALVRYQGLHAHARWGWWLKDWIDRRYVDSYRP